MEGAGKVVACYKANSEWYNKELSYKLQSTNRVIQSGISSSWLYTLILPTREIREMAKAFLTAKDIQVSQVHRRNDDYAVFKPYVKRPLQNTAAFGERMLCIPVHNRLSVGQLEFITDSLNEFAKIYI
jgi:dTDP-4-amino-4,6-dideoxygalactose transaminase